MGTNTTFNLTTLGLSMGAYTITVVAEADGYKDSSPSNAVTYIVKSTMSAPIIALNDTILAIYDTSGVAEEFEILVDGEVMQMVSKSGMLLEPNAYGVTVIVDTYSTEENAIATTMIID